MKKDERECEMLGMKNEAFVLKDFPEHSIRARLLPSALLFFCAACKWYAVDSLKHSRPELSTNPQTTSPPASVSSIYTAVIKGRLLAL